MGVSDIETEQCREQEQEKEQEAEQEQEIEMERYVDMAYQRDGEEPKRWAFCSLAEKTDATAAGLRARSPLPGERATCHGRCPRRLPEGSFYPASEFRLHSRRPLPFPPYLAVSRNHFNLEWVGERRLKNAVMVLEWVPVASHCANAAEVGRWAERLQRPPRSR